MDMLNDFTEKDMIEQIVILEDLKAAKDPATISALMDLYVTPNADHAVDEMVYHAIYDLLAGHAEPIIQGLSHPSDRVKQVCIRRAGSDVVAAAQEPLLALLDACCDNEMTGDIIRTLGMFKDKGLKDALLPYIKHDDASVVAWAMDALCCMGDPSVRDDLIAMVNGSVCMQSGASECDLATAVAVDNIAKFIDDISIDFLVANIHHVNPTFRRVVMGAAIGMGDPIWPALEEVLEKGDKDEKIMAANVIGMMGLKGGADIMVSCLEVAADLNLRFAIYEALGRIPGMRSVIALTDGLAETDEMVLLAVTTGLDQQCNPGVIKVILEHLGGDAGQADRLINAVVTSRSANLFAAIYKDGNKSAALIATLLHSDPENNPFFRRVLADLDGAESDLERLANAEDKVVVASRKILAADDSKAMLFFYKGAGVDLGMEVVTVPDGKDALEYLQAGNVVDLLVTDMNMPDMDGIELTRALRAGGQWQDLPILMASTESESSQKDLARKAGVNDFITKPFKKEDLVAKIKSMIG